MASVIETVIDLMKTFIDPPSSILARSEQEAKLPLHIGEAMTCWTYLTMLEEEISFVQIGLHTTADHELIDALHEAMTLAQSQANDLRNFLLREGIPLPPASEVKPRSEPMAVPLGVKMTEDEIANALAAKTAAGYMTCASGAVQSQRTDVGMMFARYQAETISYGASLKVLMRKRGWFKVPPYYVPNGLPTQ